MADDETLAGCGRSVDFIFYFSTNFPKEINLQKLNAPAAYIDFNVFGLGFIRNSIKYRDPRSSFYLLANRGLECIDKQLGEK